MRILVLDGNENQALASVRSLARAGHEVWVGADTPWSKAGWSRGAQRQFQYASPERDGVAFVEAIAALAAQTAGTLVMPMTERTTLCLSAERHRLDAVGARYVLPPHETLLRAVNKGETTRLAQSLGIAVPETHVLRDRAAARAFAGSARYPVVLKAATSEELTADGATRSTGAPLYARAEAEFLRVFDEMHARASAVVVQEFVQGEGKGYFALMSNGELLAEFAHRRLRDVRPTGSGSALRESIAVEPALREAGLGLLKALAWTGVAMVEFRDRGDGRPLFLEINGRFWNSLALPIHAGVDFPLLLAKLAAGEHARLTTGYRAGVRCRWFLGDARHLVAVFKGPPAGFPERFPSRLTTLVQELLPVPGTFHDNFQLSDPLPELGDWLHFFGRKVPAALRKRAASSNVPDRATPASRPVNDGPEGAR